MASVVAYEKVKDHAQRLKAFKNDVPNRKGSMGGTIYQLKDDPNKHYVVFEWDDKEAANFRNFTKTPTMKRFSDDAGVLE